jgi:hypothetical protein
MTRLQNNPVFQRAVDKGGLPAGDWADAMEQHTLRLAEIRALRPGETIDVLLLDRNWGDRVFGDRPYDVYVREMIRDKFEPSTFLRRAGATFIQGNGVPGTGTLVFWDDGNRLPDWTVEILDQKRQSWRPVDGDRFERLEPLRIDKLPGKTKVGYRGPMIRWDKMYTAPPILPFPCETD